MRAAVRASADADGEGRETDGIESDERSDPSTSSPGGPTRRSAPRALTEPLAAGLTARAALGAGGGLAALAVDRGWTSRRRGPGRARRG